MMTTEEALLHCKQQDRICGTFEQTQQRWESREKRIREFRGTTLQFIEYMKENGIRHTLCDYIRKEGRKPISNIMADIFLPDYNIVMRQAYIKGEGRYSKMYASLCRPFYYLFYIRRDETLDFLIIKLKDCIEKANKTPRTGYPNLKIVKPKRKRFKVETIEKIQ